MSVNTTVAIYGDSWADCRNGHSNSALDYLGWPYRLEGYVVKNFALAASGLYYSYKQFLTTHAKFDKIVFVVTVPGRWHLPVQLSGRTVQFNSLYSCERNKNFCATALDRAIVDAFDGYFKHVLNYEVDQTFNALMIAEIVRVRPDAILIPIVDNLIKGVPLVRYVESFVRSTRPGYLDTFKSRGWFGPELPTELNMVCHMTPECNGAVAQAVIDALGRGSGLLRYPNISSTITRLNTILLRLALGYAFFYVTAPLPLYPIRLFK